MDTSEIVIPPYRVLASPDKLPEIHSHYQARATLFESFDLDSADGALCFFAIGRVGQEWPSLVISQGYSPTGYGFNPGVLIVPECDIAFIGAGTRLLAYTLSPSPRRLWSDTTVYGFWSWAKYDGVVLMSGELELAAWTTSGAKLWTTFVEPPWSYMVRGPLLELDVMGRISTFDLVAGPAAHGA